MKIYKTGLFLLTALLTAAVATSCVKDREPAFDKKPTVRMQEALKEAQDVLMAAPNGWRMYQFMNEKNSTAIHGGYVVALKFTADKVTAWGEMCADPATSYTSLYKMTTDDGPVLSFDDNNYVLHYYSTPSGSGTNIYGQSGHYQALGGDFEFLILEAKAECVKLKGKRGGITYYLYPLEEDPATFMAKVTDMRDNFYITNFVNEENNLGVTVDMSNRHILFNYRLPATETEPAVETNLADIPFLFTETGLYVYRSLQKALAGVTPDESTRPLIELLSAIESKDFAWNAEAQTLTVGELDITGSLPEGWLPFSDYAGEYTFTYNTSTKLNVRLEVLQDRQSFRMVGLNSNYDLVLTYDLATGSLYLMGQTLGTDGDYLVWFCPWWYVSSTSNSLWRTTSYGMRTSLDTEAYATDPAHPVLNWVAGPSSAGKPINSFILYYEKDGASAGKVTNPDWLINSDYRLFYLNNLTKK